VQIVSLRSLSLIAGLLMLAVLVPADSAAADVVEVVKDGSFESTPAGQNNPNWVEGGVAPPICDVDNCGDDGGKARPRTGKNWAWFGGFPTPDLQSIRQEVTIPAGVATLTFYLWIGAASGTGLDILRVYIGDEKVFEVLEDATGYEAYKQVTIDVSAHAGAGPLDLAFEYDGSGGPFFSDFSVDDISLLAGTPAPKSVTLKGPKSVTKGKKAKLTATVAPCLGHEGDTIDLLRGKKKIASVASDPTCTARFKVRIRKTSTFQAVSLKQDDDHEAGASKKLKVRAKS
jgi:hypothetical protein